MVELENWREMSVWKKFRKSTRMLIYNLFSVIVGMPIIGIGMVFCGFGTFVAGILVIGAYMWIINSILWLCGIDTAGIRIYIISVLEFLERMK